MCVFRNGIIIMYMFVKIFLRACEHIKKKGTNKRQQNKCSRQDAQQKKNKNKRINRQIEEQPRMRKKKEYARIYVLRLFINRNRVDFSSS